MLRAMRKPAGGPVGKRGGAAYFMKSTQSGKAFPAAAVHRDVYSLLISINMVVFSGPNAGASMPKLSQYFSYTALAAALFLGFAVTLMWQVS